MIGPHDAATAALILILSGIIFSQTSIDLVAATFQINSDYTSLALWQLVLHLPRLIAIIILVSYVSHPTAKNVAFVYLLISIAVSASGIHSLRRFWGRETPFVRNINAIKSLKHLGERQDMKLSDAFRKVAPFGLQSFGFLVFYQTDVIMLGWLSNKEEVGFYGLGVIFTAAAYLLPSVFYQKFLLPTIHRLAFKEQRTLIAFSRSGGYFSFAMGLIISIIIWSFGSHVVPLIVGEEYQPSISILYVMCLAIPFRYLADHFGSVMTTRDLIMNNLKVTGMAVLINAILNFLLIREFGAYGAAVATVVSNIFLAASYFIFARKNFLR
jgi:O-antigen/teichoic acid export membrane protein